MRVNEVRKTETIEKLVRIEYIAEDGTVFTKDSTVHLSSAGDHVLNVVGVTGAVNVSIVSLLSFIFNVSGVDCDTTSLFFGSVIDLVVSEEFDVAVCERKNLCDSSCKSSLTVIYVSDCTDVTMWLTSIKLFLCHDIKSSLKIIPHAGYSAKNHYIENTRDFQPFFISLYQQANDM